MWEGLLPLAAERVGNCIKLSEISPSVGKRRSKAESGRIDHLD